LQTNRSHFFFGGRPGVAEEVAAKLTARFPGLNVAGTLCPPMRQIGPDFTFDLEAMQELEVIRESKADFIWVGLSSPKQEYWMSLAAPLLDRGVLFGVGAAFDFHAGTVKRAPRWMRENGLEWAHRLLSEPRRLWRRYLIQVPRFLIRLVKEEVGLRLKQEPSRL
jgi:N-acetylglucosaminyldiphosphoundecaprenol N-acetyl-beta-D-mannosaminyltransferase